MADWPQATNGWLMNHQWDKQLCWFPHVHPEGTELPITSSNNHSVALQWPWEPEQSKPRHLVWAPGEGTKDTRWARPRWDGSQKPPCTENVEHSMI